MKFTLLIQTLFLAFAIVMAQAVPMEKRAEKLGPNVSTLGVRFQDQYQTLVDISETIGASYDQRIASFNKNLPLAAKADNTPVPEFLVEWSGKYAKIVNEYKAATAELNKKIKALRKHLHGL